MARQILVALKSEDRLSQMVPYIEKIAQPGMRVVLLIRFTSATASNASRHDSMELECPEESVFFEAKLEKPRFTGDVRATQSMEEQRRSAEHKVFLALEALRKRGIEITVDVYTGCLRRAVKSYTCKGDVHLIVMRARSELVMNFLHKAFAIFGLVKHPTFSPILVLHPTAAV
jgi:hypothetical protein